MQLQHRFHTSLRTKKRESNKKKEWTHDAHQLSNVSKVLINTMCSHEKALVYLLKKFEEKNLDQENIVI